MVKIVFKKIINHLKLLIIKRKFGLFGENVSISHGFIIGNPENFSISNNVYIGPDAYIWAIGGLTIKENVIIGPRVTIHTSNHRYENANMIPYDGYSYLKPVTINENVWVGSNVLICPGVEIGEGAVVAMGSVVTKDVPPCCIVGGNPATTIKMRDHEHYHNLKKQKKLYLSLKKEKKVEWKFLTEK